MNPDDAARQLGTDAQWDQVGATCGNLAKLLGGYRKALLAEDVDDDLTAHLVCMLAEDLVAMMLGRNV